MRPSESFIGQPVRSLQTMLKIISEDDPALPSIIPDGIYGSSTMNAVSIFQQKYGLPITGITNQETWDTIVSVYEPASVRVLKAQPIEILLESGQILRLGDKNPYVYLAQAMLLQLSENHPISPPNVVGQLDSVTAESISQFQKLSGLDETGEIDKITWKHLVLQFTQEVHRLNSRE